MPVSTVFLLGIVEIHHWPNYEVKKIRFSLDLIRSLSWRKFQNYQEDGEKNQQNKTQTQGVCIHSDCGCTLSNLLDSFVKRSEVGVLCLFPYHLTTRQWSRSLWKWPCQLSPVARTLCNMMLLLFYHLTGSIFLPPEFGLALTCFNQWYMSE